jgi:signal transduction histidine kinase
MKWNKLLINSGMVGGVVIITAVFIILSGVVTVIFQFAVGKGFQVESMILAFAISFVLGVPFAYVFMLLLFQLEGSMADIIRNEAQIESYKKALSQNSSAEKDQLIRDLNSFAQTVAHDLKTPLTTILGFATMLADNQAKIPPEQQKDALLSIAKTAMKMNNIIQELLLLAAVRQSKVKTGPILMANVVNSVKQRLWGVILDANAQVIIPEASSWPKVIGYGAWVEEVWINYVSNAIKYGGNPARVELGSDSDYCKSVSGRSMARFWVRDNGNGLDAASKAQLFNQFTRLDQVRADGHGLGLSIVARVIEQLGGEVGVDTELGQGSTFFFTLPMVVVEPLTRARSKIVVKKEP